jgi:phenylalanyl-tRNA synthetase beta chain
MRLPISWLRDWVETDATPEAVAEALTRRGFYVEGIEHHGHSYPNVVVARVLEVAKHPNADKLSLCKVDDGSGTPLGIVCGAPNVRAGMVVPCARIGAVLPGDFRIEKRKVRGEESQGMLCSARELQLSDDHGGILDLVALRGSEEGLVPGTAIDELFGPPDALLEVEVPFNRPDGLGVMGLAREVCAAVGGRWTEAARALSESAWEERQGFDLALDDTDGCPRYLAQVIEGVTIAPSPAWLQRRLEAMGQRPINNVVDLTNLVLFEYGQPVHAFDLDRLAGPAIRVRRARAGERFTTLDGRERELTPEVLLICDAARPVALAGVMGGADSEVHDGTTRLLLECAWFRPTRVRRGARSLGITTEASKRFERGVDPGVQRFAARRFLDLLLELCPGATLAAGAELDHLDHAPRRLTLRGSRIARVAGIQLADDDARRHLEALGFEVAGADPLHVTVPSWRLDVSIEDDLVEEVARSHGYDHIPEVPLETHGVHAMRSPRERRAERAKAAMLARGVSEAWTTTLVSEREALACAALTGEEPAPVRLANPMSRESEVLRPNPVPGLLRAVAHNLRQGAPAVRLFELGAGFRATGQALPEERAMLAAVVTGARWAHAHDASQQPLGFDDAKGLWEAWLEEMGVDMPEWRAYPAAGWKPGASAEVADDTSRIAWAGTLGLPLLREWGIEVPVHLFLVLLDALPDGASKRAGVSLPGRFPPVRRDLAFFVPASVTHHEVHRALAAAAGERLASMDVFDVYAGPGTPEGMKSLAFALQFQHPERTLTESEVQAIQDRMVRAVEKDCGGRLRER